MPDLVLRLGALDRAPQDVPKGRGRLSKERAEVARRYCPASWRADRDGSAFCMRAKNVFGTMPIVCENANGEPPLTERATAGYVSSQKHPSPAASLLGWRIAQAKFDLVSVYPKKVRGVLYGHLCDSLFTDSPLMEALDKYA